MSHAGESGSVNGVPNSVREAIELALLLDATYWCSGIDVRHYPRAALGAAVEATRLAVGAPTITALLDRVVHQEAAMRHLMRALSALAPAPEQSDAVLLGWQATLLPLLRSTPFPRLWVIDCVDDQLLLRLLTLLEEEGLLARTSLFVTSDEPSLLRRLQDAVDHASFHTAPRIIWNEYCLLSDATFNEFEFILCGRALAEHTVHQQRRMVRLIGESLSQCGLLHLATPGADDCAALAPIFLPVAIGQNLYRHATLELQAQRRRH